MKYYKNTYLVRTSEAATSSLISVSGKEWYEIAKQNRSNPDIPRRFFICDTIVEDETMDRVFMEVSESEYKQWRSEQQAARRWLDSSLDIKVLSLDSPAQEDGIDLDDTIQTESCMEELCIDKVLLQELEEEITKWKPWAADLLGLYIRGQQRHSTVWLANRCGVSQQMARKYRKVFESIVKKFLF